MSLLKSVHSICMWFECASICILIVVVWLRLILYLQYVKACINVLLAMIVMDDFLCMICKYGEMFARDGIFVMFPGNGYFWFISVSKPSLVGVYGILR